MKTHCKYHPLEPAAWHCAGCRLDLCGGCSPELPGADAHSCPLCSAELTHLGAANSAAPFWTRLGEFFNYPLQAAPMVFMALSVLVPVLLPSEGVLALVGGVLLLLLQIRYGFAALERTAQGRMTPPPLSELLKTEHLGLGFKMFGVILVAIVANAFVGRYSAVLGVACLLLTVVAVPASLMILAIDKDINSAASPRLLYGLISRIGIVPYGLLCLFLFLVLLCLVTAVRLLADIMSPAVLAPVIGVAGNYYTLVMMHMMGYVLFQYQAELGFAAAMEEGHRPRRPRRVDPQQLQFEILLKEGQYARALAQLRSEITRRPDHVLAHERHFQLASALNEEDALRWQASGYFKALMLSGREMQLASLLKNYLARYPGFTPDDPDVRYELAQALQQAGEPKLAVHVLNGLHKDSPHYPRLVEAYLLAARVLNEQLALPQKAAALIQFLEGRFRSHRAFAEVEAYKAVLAAKR